MAKSLRSKSQRRNRDVKRTTMTSDFKRVHDQRVERLAAKLAAPKPKRERTPEAVLEEIVEGEVDAAPEPDVEMEDAPAAPLSNKEIERRKLNKPRKAIKAKRGIPTKFGKPRKHQRSKNGTAKA